MPTVSRLTVGEGPAAILAAGSDTVDRSVQSSVPMPSSPSSRSSGVIGAAGIAETAGQPRGDARELRAVLLCAAPAGALSEHINSRTRVTPRDSIPVLYPPATASPSDDAHSAFVYTDPLR